MRVIAGSARSLNLKTVEGLSTRPTTDRIKETLFNIINNSLYGCVFIDLFAGSGAIGIEALSRGASKAYFVENNKIARKCIDENLRFTRLDKNAVVMETDAVSAINKLKNQGIKADIIFMDPPYNMEHEKYVMEALKDADFIHEDTIIIVEASLSTAMEYVEDMGFQIYRVKEYKTNKHFFIEKCK